MEKIYTDYLLSKRILVSDVDKQVDSNETVALALFCLYNEYGIVITRGKELVTAAVTRKLIEQLGGCVPDAFFQLVKTCTGIVFLKFGTRISPVCEIGCPAGVSILVESICKVCHD